MVRTKPTIYSRGTRIGEILEVYLQKCLNGAIVPGLVKVITTDGFIAFIAPWDLEPQDEVDREIERVMKKQEIF